MLLPLQPWRRGSVWEIPGGVRLGTRLEQRRQSPPRSLVFLLTLGPLLRTRRVEDSRDASQRPSLVLHAFLSSSLASTRYSVVCTDLRRQYSCLLQVLALGRGLSSPVCSFGPW